MIGSYGLQVHSIYRKFAERFILQGNCLFTIDENILTPENLSQCFDRYVVNYLEDKSSFENKIERQFGDASPETWAVFAHAIWLWSYAAGDINEQTKRARMEQIFKDLTAPDVHEVFCWGFGYAGTYHKNNKYNEVRFNLILIKFLRDKVNAGAIVSVEDVLDWTERLCIYQKYEQEDPAFAIPDEVKAMVSGRAVAMCNILCYVAKPDRYERIASDDHKWQIVNSFSGLLSAEELDSESLNRDEKIALIRNQIAQIIGNKEFDFYDEDDVAFVWNYSLSEEGVDVVQGLQYKKAIILFGPPGTSKTHTAMSLAQAVVRTQYLKKREHVERFLKEETDLYLGRIHHLQLHTNYNYEDFIAGVQLIDHNMKVQPGKLFKICDLARADKDMHHVLILDEINRVDLSRLFGEAFSALENRGTPVELSLGDLSLNIPDNLYVIGTMNEIDFSLERMDFALRRRFLWYEYTFNRDTLKSIIEHKQLKHAKKIHQDEISRFIANAIRVNDSISGLPDLGKQYKIGHTFFAEIVDLVYQYKALKGYSKSLKNNIYRDAGPAEILWNISIKPMIEAFLGNMDHDSKDQMVEELRKDYYHV